MTRILVTGGAGFIGSHVVDLVVAGGHDVVVLDSLRVDVHPERPGHLNPGASYVAGDVRDPDAWLTAADGVDAVCHHAARVGLGVDFGDVRSYVADNDAGTAAGLWALHQRRFRGRFVLAGSMVVYGEGAYRCEGHGAVRPSPRRTADLAAGKFDPGCPVCGETLTPEPVDEDMPADPRNVYAATKLHQEHLCGAFAREHGTALTVLRYHNVYGPRLPKDTAYAGVAALFVAALHAGRAPEVFEDGQQLRDFVHVSDVAAANVLALTGDEPVPGTFNIASGEPRTIRDLAEALADGSGPAAPRPVIVPRWRGGDVRHVFGSADLARTRLGFTAGVDFVRGTRALAAELAQHG